MECRVRWKRPEGDVNAGWGVGEGGDDGCAEAGKQEFARLERSGDTCRVVFQTELEGWEQQCVLMPGTWQEQPVGASLAALCAKWRRLSDVPLPVYPTCPLPAALAVV